MAFIPSDAEWYIADLVEETRVIGRKRQSVYINTILIQADSPEMAYKKAIKFGKAANHRYKNLNGEQVICRFRGIRELNVVHEKLKDGAEIFYKSRSRMTEEGIRRLVTDKKKLAVFQDIGPVDRALYPQTIADKLLERLRAKEARP